MNRCKYCGKPLTLTPEYDTCIECQGRIMREATMPQNSFTTNSTKLSMNIYDEAKQSWERLYKSYEENYFAPMPTRSDLDTIRIALERAKKEHELLELYQNRELNRNLMTITPADEHTYTVVINRKEKELEEDYK